jgi:hypothetical protein
MLANRLTVMPTASGLMALSRALMASKLRVMAAGSSPSRTATRFTAERRSRRRVPERPTGPLNLDSNVAKVSGSAPTSLRDHASMSSLVGPAAEGGGRGGGAPVVR